MKELTSTRRDVQEYYHILQARIVEEQDNLAQDYRVGGPSIMRLSSIDHLQKESVLAARLIKPLAVLQFGPDPLYWIRAEKSLRYVIRDLADFYENQNVPHPQCISRQYPAEWEHKLH